MDKLRMETNNLTEKNIEKIASLFPNVITEKKDENGKLRKGINFELLKQELYEDVIDGEECYDFTWVGKKAAIAESNTPIRKTLRPCIEESKNWENTENLYIEGDNLEVLKLLQESYLNSIKMIYIDPPYNTGNDFIYKDNFKIDKEEYEEQIGLYDEEENMMFKNTDTNGRFHSDWCSMMYPRLKLAYNLLSEDGVIFISIDDNEVENLRKICDEVFGTINFIATIIRNTNSSKNQSLFVSVSHEYCLIYSKNIEFLKDKHAENKWSVPKNNIKEYMAKVNQLKNEGIDNEEITTELKTLTKYPRFIDFTNYWYLDDRGLYRKDNIGGVKNGNKEPIINPITKTYDPIPPGGYRYSIEKLEELVKDDRIHFHSDGSIPTVKRYLHEYENQRPKSIMSDDQRPDYSMLQKFNTPFDNPKQLSFMERIISIVDDDAIVLDFFAGSSTTAHAVMQLNAEDGGNRKFIMAQLPEKTEEISEAYNAGYKNICEIGKERIRKAGEKIKSEIEESNKELKDNEEPKKVPDIGFRVLKVDSTNMKDVYYSANEYTQEKISDLVSNIKDDRTDLDLLYGVMLDWGLQLSLKHEINEIDGATVHVVDEGSLVACFEENVSESVIIEIANLQPIRVVFRDSCFEGSPEKINVEEIFKLLATNTAIRVI